MQAWEVARRGGGSAAVNDGVAVKRAMKMRALGVLRRSGAFAAARRASRKRLRILCYHNIWLGPRSFRGDSMFMNARDFLRRMQLLKAWGYTVLPLDRALEQMAANSLPDDSVVITIDDGWFGTFHTMLPILRAACYDATIFCDTGHLEWGKPVPHVFAAYVKLMHPIASGQAEAAYREATDLNRSLPSRLDACRALCRAAGVDFEGIEEKRVFSYMTPSQLCVMKTAGMNVQLHTHTHSLHDFTFRHVAWELSQNRRVLAEVLRCERYCFADFCYPSGLTGSGAAHALRANNVRSAVTLEPRLCRAAQEDLLALPRLIDGSHQTDLEFEADLCGLGAVTRAGGRLLSRLHA